MKKDKADAAIGDRMHRTIVDLFPICRSITGDGLRETLRYVKEEAGCEIVEVLTGTKVFDWEVPPEWNIKDAYIKNSKGNRVVDFRANNLHVVNYSGPVSGTFSLAELAPRLHTISERPDAIPYRTSYYQRTWGFCLTANQLSSLADDEYEVLIDSTLEAGSLSYGELYIPGRLEKEILISCHCCHPSLANDNLSGIAVAIELARILKSSENNFSYRFLFIPGTIGAISWLAANETALDRIKGGLTLANLGDSGYLNYKKSRQGDGVVDRAVEYVLSRSGARSGIRDFSPYGYDERQYCSPGINLPVGCLSRSVYGTFPEYHTSDDNISFVKPECLQDSLETLLAVIDTVDADLTFQNIHPKGEPQLGKRGLYSTTGGYGSVEDLRLAYLWVLNYSDSRHSLLNIERRSGLSFEIIVEAAEHLVDAGLVEIAD